MNEASVVWQLRKHFSIRKWKKQMSNNELERSNDRRRLWVSAVRQLPYAHVDISGQMKNFHQTSLYPWVYSHSLPCLRCVQPLKHQFVGNNGWTMFPSYYFDVANKQKYCWWEHQFVVFWTRTYIYMSGCFGSRLDQFTFEVSSIYFILNMIIFGA